MEIIAFVPWIMLIVGTVVYFVAANPKAQELGKLCAAAGLFAIAFGFAGRLIHFG
jgi:hypothetical protein